MEPRSLGLLIIGAGVLLAAVGVAVYYGGFSWFGRLPGDIRYHGERTRVFRCLRCLLLVMCTYPFAKKALTLYLARSEGHERYFGCNLMQCKVLASSHQHLIAEAPEVAPQEAADSESREHSTHPPDDR